MKGKYGTIGFCGDGNGKITTPAGGGGARYGSIGVKIGGVGVGGTLPSGGGGGHWGPDGGGGGGHWGPEGGGGGEGGGGESIG